MQALSSLSAVLAQPAWLPQALILSRASAFPVTGPERSGWALGPHWPNAAGSTHAPSSLAGCLPTKGLGGGLPWPALLWQTALEPQEGVGVCEAVVLFPSAHAPGAQHPSL